MNEPQFLDTNILVYSISLDPLEHRKRQVALQLLSQPGNAVSVQVLQEFYVQATRERRHGSVPHDVALELVGGWKRFLIQDMTLEIFDRALWIKARYRLSYWDSAIVAAAKNMSCKLLYTEDMSHGQKIEGVEIMNPFL